MFVFHSTEIHAITERSFFLDLKIFHSSEGLLCANSLPSLYPSQPWKSTACTVVVVVAVQIIFENQIHYISSTNFCCCYRFSCIVVNTEVCRRTKQETFGNSLLKKKILFFEFASLAFCFLIGPRSLEISFFVSLSRGSLEGRNKHTFQDGRHS